MKPGFHLHFWVGSTPSFDISLDMEQHLCNKVRKLPPGSETCSTSLSDLWEVYDLFYNMCQFILLTWINYMAWHKHNHILLQCYVNAWPLWRYFNILILKVCCMLESSGENKCLRISGSGTQASIFFKVFQMNSMWNQVLYESISEQM